MRVLLCGCSRSCTTGPSALTFTLSPPRRGSMTSAVTATTMSGARTSVRKRPVDPLDHQRPRIAHPWSPVLTTPSSRPSSPRRPRAHPGWASPPLAGQDYAVTRGHPEKGAIRPIGPHGAAVRRVWLAEDGDRLLDRPPGPGEAALVDRQLGARRRRSTRGAGRWRGRPAPRRSPRAGAGCRRTHRPRMASSTSSTGWRTVDARPRPGAARSPGLALATTAAPERSIGRQLAGPDVAGQLGMQRGVGAAGAAAQALVVELDQRRRTGRAPCARAGGPAARGGGGTGPARRRAGAAGAGAAGAGRRARPATRGRRAPGR